MENMLPQLPFLATLVCLLLAESVQGHLLSQPTIDLHIQAQEQLISQHNDSAYVQRLMRLAKSAEMRSYINPKQEPCDNFYEYSCGRWPLINPANDAHPRETNLEQLVVKAYRHKQQRLLEQPPNEETDAEAVFQLKQFYASCLLYRQTPEDLYQRQLHEIVGEFGRMPVLSLPGQEWAEDAFDWLDTVAKIKRRYGLDIVLLLQLQSDRIYVGQPNQILPGPDSRARTESIAENLERHLAVEPKLALKTGREITELEQLLAKGMLSRRVGVLAKLRTPEELDEPYSEIFNVTQYVEIVLERELADNETIYEHVSSYMTHLADVVVATPPRVLANYIFYELLDHFFYDRTVSPVEQCVNRIREQFPELLENMVYQQYGDAATLSDINGVWQQIQRSFRGVLENASADWLSTDTRAQLLGQLNETELVINGYVNINFTEKFAGFAIKPRDYLHNLRTVQSRESLVTKPKIQTVASYDPVKKRVLLPVALLQPNILWSRFYPRAVRFGSLGTVLAHELAHSLEDAAKWDAKSFAQYSKRKACFKDQYSRLRLHGEYLPESDLQAENIADNLAIQVAYHAYRRYLAELASSALVTEVLPQLDHTPRQLFFLSYGQLWCNDANEQFREKESLLQTSTPNALRVLGALSNFPAFGQDFACISGNQMMAPKKCHLFTINID